MTTVYYPFSRMEKEWYSIVTFFILIAGAILSPLAHAAFFYVGEIHKAIYYTDVIAHPYLIGTASGFVKMLNITWRAAIIVLAIGWVAFAVRTEAITMKIL